MQTLARVPSGIQSHKSQV